MTYSKTRTKKMRYDFVEAAYHVNARMAYCSVIDVRIHLKELLFSITNLQLTYILICFNLVRRMIVNFHQKRGGDQWPDALQKIMKAWMCLREILCRFFRQYSTQIDTYGEWHWPLWKCLSLE
jgi:hypothetical protein